MATCSIAPGDKRQVAQRVGRHLVGLYGKRRAYSPPLVKAAMRRCNLPDAWDCWALSLFASPDDFVAYHRQIGEACDYGAMHAEMLGAIGAGPSLDADAVDAGAGGGWFDWLDGIGPGDVGLSDHSP